MNSSTPWNLIQAGWIWSRDPKVYVKYRPQPGRQLFQERFQWGTSAYVITRSGMGMLLDAFFSDRSSTGLIRLLDKGEVVEYYFDALGTGVYVSVPSLFTVLEGKSTIAGRDEYRHNLHLQSNNVHTRETFDLAFARLHSQST